jgi:signal peptidase I
METVLLAVVIFLALNTATGRFQVRGASMLPTLQNGQYLVISKLTYWIHPPQRGDIIVFHPPTNPGEDYIKRVVGLSGEQVEIRAGEVAIDGQPLDEPYVNNPGTYSGSWTLGEGEYFVLGDNRRNSSDSHTFGVISGETVVGKAWVSYWPPESWSVVPHHSYEELAPEEG